MTVDGVNRKVHNTVYIWFWPTLHISGRASNCKRTEWISYVHPITTTTPKHIKYLQLSAMLLFMVQGANWNQYSFIMCVAIHHIYHTQIYKYLQLSAMLLLMVQGANWNQYSFIMCVAAHHNDYTQTHWLPAALCHALVNGARCKLKPVQLYNVCRSPSHWLHHDRLATCSSLPCSRSWCRGRRSLLQSRPDLPFVLHLQGDSDAALKEGGLWARRNAEKRSGEWDLQSLLQSRLDLPFVLALQGDSDTALKEGGLWAHRNAVKKSED